MDYENEENGFSIGLRTALFGAFEELQERFVRAGNAIGTLTGFPCLDQLTNGLQSGELILLAAKPGMGKTAFALDVAANVAVSGGSVFIHSLQMTPEQIALRLISSQTKVAWGRMRSGKLEDEDWGEVTASIRKLQNVSLEIGVSSRDVLAGIRRQAFAMKQANRVDLIIIDDLEGLVGDTKKSKPRRMATLETLRSLKQLALECEAPVLLLFSLRGGLEANRERRPILADIRWFHTIEDQLDTVMFLHREDCHENYLSKSGMVEVIVPVQGNGNPALVATLMFDENWLHFRNSDGHASSQ